MPIDYIDFLRDLIIDLIAIYILAYAIYYRRYGDREMVITMGLQFSTAFRNTSIPG